MHRITGPFALVAVVVSSPALASAPKIAFEVPAQYRLIDGIATDGSTFWLSSVQDRVIVVHRGDGFRAIKLPADAGRPRGLDFDPRRNLLWIATDCPVGVDAGACTTGMLLAMDHNGTIKKRLLPSSGKPADFDQVGVSSYGDVYKVGDQTTEQVTVTDVRNGITYVCRDECTSLDDIAQLMAAGQFRNLKDSGVKVAPAPTPPAQAAGNDIAGMAFAGSYVIATQRQPGGGRVIAFQRYQGRVHNARQLADASVVPEPGQVATFGTRAWVVADSQWSTYAGATPGVQRPTPVVVMSVPQ